MYGSQCTRTLIYKASLCNCTMTYLKSLVIEILMFSNYWIPFMLKYYLLSIHEKKCIIIQKYADEAINFHTMFSLEWNILRRYFRYQYNWIKNMNSQKTYRHTHINTENIEIHINAQKTYIHTHINTQKTYSHTYKYTENLQTYTYKHTENIYIDSHTQRKQSYHHPLPSTQITIHIKTSRHQLHPLFGNKDISSRRQTQI